MGNTFIDKFFFSAAMCLAIGFVAAVFLAAYFGHTSPASGPETAWNGVAVPICRQPKRSEVLEEYPVCPEAVMKHYQSIVRFGYTGMDYGNGIHCTFPAQVNAEYMK